MQHNFHVYDDMSTLAEAAARFVIKKIDTCLETSSRCRIALPGGRTPASCLKILAQGNLPWDRIDWYLGDERCLPIGHAERNDVMICENLFSGIPDGENNFHPIRAELGAEDAANEYAKIIDTFDAFDIVILGMGEDGHTASLFPDNAALHDSSNSVVAVHKAPKPPDDRVSLSLKTLTDARLRIILAAGSDKKPALDKIRAGEKLPVNCIGASEWFVDTAAVS